tara:strand:+ start:741 stop:986 length:246 start_codon:yes stop_codon:yes gene_type:complete
MKDYLVQEEYKEYTVGVRVIRVQAESKQHVLDGDYEEYDVIEEITASGDVEETNLIVDKQFLAGGWTELVRECDDLGEPIE